MFPKRTPKSRFSNLNDEDWLNLLVNPDRFAPSLPSEDIQVMFCGRSGLQAMQQALEFYKVIKDFCRKDGKSLKSMRAVLDFGCGWGRITRCFLREIGPGVLYGCDYVPEMVEICQKSIPSYHFIKNDAMPPLPFEQGKFDLIYGFSVFSHLSETAHKAWLQEFHRILKSRGILVLTTRPRYFINYWPNLPYLPRIDVDQLLKEYDAAKYIHIPCAGGFNLSDSFYGETAIPHQYINNHWDKLFRLEEFRGDIPHVDQDVIILTKL